MDNPPVQFGSTVHVQSVTSLAMAAHLRVLSTRTGTWPTAGPAEISRGRPGYFLTARVVKSIPLRLMLTFWIREE